MKTNFLILLIPGLLLSKVFPISYDGSSPVSSGMRYSDNALLRSNVTGPSSNPALVYAADEYYFNSSYRDYFSDIDAGCISVIVPKPFGAGGTAAVSLTGVNYGVFKNIEEGSEYNPYEIMAEVTYGEDFSGLFSSGINARYIYSKIEDYSSSAVTADISVHKMLFDQRLGLSAGVYNAGYQLFPYYNTDEKIVQCYKMAGSYALKRLPLSLAAAYCFYQDGFSSTACGLEFVPKKNLTVRAGYDFSLSDKDIGTNSKSEKFGGLSLGLGLMIKYVYVNTSYMINGELDNELSFSIGTSINELLK